MSDYTCSVCGKSLEYGGRGRPPTKCDEHKASASAPSTTAALRSRPGKPAEPAAAAPRQRPGGKTVEVPAAEVMRPRPGASKPAENSPEEALKASEDSPAPRLRPGAKPAPAGTPDTKSRVKAEGAHNRMADQVEASGPGWPMTSDGRPMSRIEMAASELVPTGQYANVSVGPARITMFVDFSEKVNGSFFTGEERSNMAKALNELAEVVEADVIAVQRSIVLDSMQDQITTEK